MGEQKYALAVSPSTFIPQTDVGLPITGVVKRKNLPFFIDEKKKNKRRNSKVLQVMPPGFPIKTLRKSLS